MLLKAYNRTLINDREKTYLTAAASAGSTSLTVAAVIGGTGNVNQWADNDYVIIGEVGTETAELMQVNSTPSDGTTLTVDRSGSSNTRFAHAIGEPIYKIAYNRVEFSRNTTDTSAGASVLATIAIEPDDEYTAYEDTTNTTGYGFIRFNNSTASTFSSYSDGVNYESSGDASSYDPRTLWNMRRKVRTLLDEDRPGSKLTDRKIDETLNDKQADIAHQRLWSFYESERSFSAVANQLAYDLPSTIQKVYAASFDTQPVMFVPRTRWDILHWDTNSTSTKPTHATFWNRQLKFYPRPSSAAQTTTLNGAISSTTATTITVTSTSGFNIGDYYRFIIDSEVIYATASTSTTFTGCLRGQEGTTAATHTDTTTVTERDIVYTGHVEPNRLVDISDRTAIPEPDVLVWGTAADLAFLLNKQDVHDRLSAKYEKGIKELESKYALKQTSQLGRVRNANEFLRENNILLNQNLYPHDITGS